MKHEYVFQKEAHGYSVWSCAPFGGDKRDLLSEHRTKRDALAAIERYHNADARRAKESES